MQAILEITKQVVKVTIDMTKAILNSAGEMEQAQVAFETMLRSEQKADKLLKEIIEFAATTPFELPGLVESSKRLLAFGVAAEDIIPTMTQLGNIAAGVGREKLPQMIRAFGKIKVRGNATMRELNSFIAAGVPILDELAKNLGVSTEEIFKLVRAGKIGFKEVAEATKTMSTGTGQFANLMEKQSKTYLGILTNIQDQFTRIANEAGKELLPVAKNLANAFLDFLKSNRKLIATGIVKWLKGFLEIVAFLFFFVKRLWENLKDTATISKVGKIFETLGRILGKLFEVIANLIGLLGKALGPIFNFILDILQPVLDFIGVLIDAFLIFIKSFDNVGDFFRKIAKSIADFFVNLWEKVINTIKGFWDGLVNIVKGIWDWILSIVKKAGEIIGDVLGKINDAVNAVAEFFGGGEAAFTGRVVEPKQLTPEEILTRNLSMQGLTPAGNTNINVNSDITIGVPAGTPEGVVAEAEAKSREAVKKEWNLILNNGFVNLTGGAR